MSGALLAATGFQGLADVDDTLEAATPGKNASFQTDEGRNRDCPFEHRERRLQRRDGV